MAGVEVRAVQRHIRMSPQKVRLVLDVVRGKNAREALAILKFLPQRAARPVAATVRSAMANAENSFNMDPDELIIPAFTFGSTRRGKETCDLFITEVASHFR